MPTSAQCLKAFGDPSKPENECKYMTSWDVPEDINKAIPAIPNRIYCNKAIVQPLEKAFRNLIKAGKAAELRTWDGCFNVRNKRELLTLSLHSWGLAVDVNAAWNGLNKKPTLSPEFVKAFTDAGFEWGGTWKRQDGMHFQIIKL